VGISNHLIRDLPAETSLDVKDLSCLGDDDIFDIKGRKPGIWTPKLDYPAAIGRIQDVKIRVKAKIWKPAARQGYEAPF
jgi:hypothetical protein